MTGKTIVARRRPHARPINDDENDDDDDDNNESYLDDLSSPAGFVYDCPGRPETTKGLSCTSFVGRPFDASIGEALEAARGHFRQRCII